MRYNHQDAMHMHLHGFCNVFAIIASKMKNMECYAIIRYCEPDNKYGLIEGEPILIHAFLKVNDKIGFDAKGFRPIEQIYDDYQTPDDYTCFLITDAYEFLKEKSTPHCFGMLNEYNIQWRTIPLIKYYFLQDQICVDIKEQMN